MISNTNSVSTCLDKIKFSKYCNKKNFPVIPTYQGVKLDFGNNSPQLNEDGVVEFHDIDCPDLPGINKFWNELKKMNKGKIVIKGIFVTVLAIR